MFLGIVFSVIVSVFFSLYIIPRKFSRQSPTLYTVFLGLSFFVGSAIWYLIAWGFEIRPRETLFSIWHLLSCLRGASWAVAAVLLNIAIDKIGLSKSNQWKNLQGPIGSILMLSLLGDVVGIKVAFVVGGMIAIFVSAMLFTIRKDTENKRSINIGVMFAVAAAFLFGFNAYLQKVLTNKDFVYSQLFWVALAMFVTAIVIQSIKKGRRLWVQRHAAKSTPPPTVLFSKQILLPLLAGLLYCVAAIFNVLAYTKIAGSVAFSIVQLNAVWTILIGIFIFKEIDFRKNWLRITSGLAFAIGAIVLLIFAL
jgi:glucose uptake protein GlcU